MMDANTPAGALGQGDSDWWLTWATCLSGVQVATPNLRRSPTSSRLRKRSVIFETVSGYFRVTLYQPREHFDS